MNKVRNHGDRWETVAAIALDIVQIILEIIWGIENLKQKSKKKKEQNHTIIPLQKKEQNHTIIPLPGSDRT